MPASRSTRNLPRPILPAYYWLNGVKQTVDPSGQGRGAESGWQQTDSFRGNENYDYTQMSGPELRRNLRPEYNRRYDTGHDFFTTKYEFDYGPRTWAVSTSHNGSVVVPGRKLEYLGPIYPSWTTSARPSITGVSSATLDAWGRTAISKTLPAAPNAGVATAFAELREGLPKLVAASLHKQLAKQRSLRNAATGAGEETLNWEFGMKPLANDIATTANAVLDFNKNYKKLMEGNGKIIHRRASLPDDVKTEFFPDMGEPPNVYLPRMNATRVEDQFYSTIGGMASLSKHTVRKVWFSGAYTYWLQTGEDFGSRLSAYADKADYLLGATLSPEVVWNVSAWSWLIDWFSDVNVFARNVTYLQPDQQVMRYGYIMCESTEKWTKYARGYSARPSSNFPTAVSSSYTSVTKQRKAATPYGFGLDIGGFTNRQWSILGSLGMTRSDKKLRRG